MSYSDEELKEIPVSEAEELDEEDKKRYNELKKQKTEGFIEDKKQEEKETRREGFGAFVDELSGETTKKIELGEGYIKLNIDPGFDIQRKYFKIQQKFQKYKDLETVENFDKVEELLDEVFDLLDGLILNVDRDELNDTFRPDKYGKGMSTLKKLVNLVGSELEESMSTKKKGQKVS